MSKALTKRTKTSPTAPNSSNYDALKLFTAIVKEVGSINFLLIIAVFIFLFSGTLEQKQEFIDRFILLKNVQNEPFPFSFVVALLVFINILSFTYYRFKLKLLNKELDRVANEKSELQEKVIQKRLRSSK